MGMVPGCLLQSTWFLATMLPKMFVPEVARLLLQMPVPLLLRVLLLIVAVPRLRMPLVLLSRVLLLIDTVPPLLSKPPPRLLGAELPEKVLLLMVSIASL